MPQWLKFRTFCSLCVRVAPLAVTAALQIAIRVEMPQQEWGSGLALTPKMATLGLGLHGPALSGDAVVAAGGPVIPRLVWSQILL